MKQQLYVKYGGLALLLLVPAMNLAGSASAGAVSEVFRSWPDHRYAWRNQLIAAVVNSTASN
jgi:hypothetical protein